MTIYDIPNIEHCDVQSVTATLYRIIAHEGWYIHKSTDPVGEDENGNPTKLYRGAAVIRTDAEDLSGIEITAEADLPPNAEICGDTDNDHEVM